MFPDNWLLVFMVRGVIAIASQLGEFRQADSAHAQNAGQTFGRGPAWATGGHAFGWIKAGRVQLRASRQAGGGQARAPGQTINAVPNLTMGEGQESGPNPDIGISTY